MAPGMIGAPHQGAGLDVAKAELLRFRFEFVELSGRDIALDGKLIPSRLEVLPQGDDVTIDLPQVFERGHDLVEGLPDAEHQAGFGEKVRTHPLGALEQIQRSLIHRARPDLPVQPRHGFHIVVENMDPRAHDSLQGLLVSLEVRNQDLHPNAGVQRFDPKDGLGEMGRAAVGEVVAIHRRYHDVLKAQLLDHSGNIARLFRVEQVGLALADGTKAAAAGAGVSEDQKGRRAMPPALADIRAARLLANRVEVVLSQDTLEAEVVWTAGESGPDPVWVSSWHSSRMFE